MKPIFIICILLSVTVDLLAQGVVGEDVRDGLVGRAGAVETPAEDTESTASHFNLSDSTPALSTDENAPRPRLRPANLGVSRPRASTGTVTRWQGGQSRADFTSVNRRISNAPIWGAFTNLFTQCAPGCAPQRLGTWRKIPRGGRARSCHHLGKAVDLGGIKCSGRSYNAYTQRFKDFVACVKTKSYRGTRWRTLYRQTHKGRNNCHLRSRNKTSCHWDHVHISMGCSVRGT